jgi:hypothetical protein
MNGAIQELTVDLKGEVEVGVWVWVGIPQYSITIGSSLDGFSDVGAFDELLA